MHGGAYIGSNYYDLIYEFDKNALFWLTTLLIQMWSYNYTLSTGGLHLEQSYSINHHPQKTCLT